MLHSIAAQSKQQNQQSIRIIVDQQIEFNKDQQELLQTYQSMRDAPPDLGLGLPIMDLKDMPAVPITVVSSTQSSGLELVDIFLWIFQRQVEGKKAAKELLALIDSQHKHGLIEAISIKGIADRWFKK